MGSRAFHGVFPWMKNKAPLTGTRDPASAVRALLHVYAR